MEAKWGEGGEWILLGENAGDLAVMLLSISGRIWF
jgi:hypothetical protein